MSRVVLVLGREEKDAKEIYVERDEGLARGLKVMMGEPTKTANQS